MMTRSRYVQIVWLILIAVLAAPWWAAAQDEQKSEAAPASETPALAASSAPQPSLADSQEGIANRFKRLESTLLQMAEYMHKNDPERADLLIRAIAQSKERRIGSQMRKIIELLSQQDRDGKSDPLFGEASSQQGELISQLQAMLALLQSEDRRSELEKEKERIKELLQNLNRIIGKEKDVRVATERGGDSDTLAGRQGDVAKQTGDLVKKIDGQDKEKKGSDAGGDKKPDRQDSKDDKSGDGKSGDEKSPDKKSDGGDPSDGKKTDPDSNEKQPKTDSPEKPGAEQGAPKAGSPKSGQPKPGEGKPSNNKPSDQPPSDSPPSPSPPDEGQPGDQKPQQNPQSDSNQDQKRTPGRDDIEQARREMERAIEELKLKALDKASEHQDEALQKLAEAKEKLEEILRQLREEERKLFLAMLEARFRKMLDLQLVVYHETVRLGKVGKDEWSAVHHGRSEQLARDEEVIVLEATKALTILKEEGSSVAFPEAIEQLRDDMQTIVRRLERAEVGELTQTIEKDVIEALEEIIEALQKEMEKLDDKQQQPPQQQPQEPQDPPLVDSLSELKMLRTLQLRINRRTKSLGQLIDDEQATNTDVVQQLQELATRQARVQAATYDLVVGRNR